MTKPFKGETRYRHDWSVTLCTDPEGQGFYAQCTSPKGLVLCTDIYSDKGLVWQQGYELVDRTIHEEQTRRYNAVALPLTLALLYVSGGDEYGELGNEQCFKGRRAWKSYDFDVLDLLTTAGFIEEQRYPQQVKSVVLTPKGIKEARRFLQGLNLDGVKEFLGTLAEHDDLPDESENE
ncbi:hypothetical protein H6G74_28090 [Nostoc spongiaeforme FACHB-130]|uniref:DUF6429 domain-containing protein n=1 Tax=Nostoc spongiaeforme FACHB-130 TaxID=1357510 RepID=A0ABR8G4J8_9NOSO|nr:DUF6429 family protein [Nostoc spongiaeforme]MBD2598157.1 hypothetical protein [Nostoc spongiaeforme FACHB-130]